MGKHLIRTGLFFLTLLAALVGTVLLWQGPVVQAFTPLLEPEADAPVQLASETTTTADRQLWQVCVRGSGRGELYSSQGDWLQALDFAGGETATMAMPPGDYWILCDSGRRVGFRLAQNASLTMLGGAGWTDGEILYVTDLPGCSVEVVCWLTQDEWESGAYETTRLELWSGENMQSMALTFSPDQEPEDNGYYRSSCRFEGLSPGTYALQRNGQPVVEMELTRIQPDYMVVLGGEK